MIEFLLFGIATASMVALLVLHVQRVANEKHQAHVDACKRQQDRIANRRTRAMRVPYPFHTMDNL